MFDLVELRQLETELERMLDKLEHYVPVTREEGMFLYRECLKIVREIVQIKEIMHSRRLGT